MQLPSFLQGESLTRLLQGAAAGAVAIMFVGFYWGGWSLGSTADKMAKERSDLAVVSALAPVCADKFRALPDAEAKLVALSKVDSWKRGDEFPKEFVTLPGDSYASSALVNVRSRPRSIRADASREIFRPRGASQLRRASRPRISVGRYAGIREAQAHATARAVRDLRGSHPQGDA